MGCLEGGVCEYGTCVSIDSLDQCICDKNPCYQGGSSNCYDKCVSECFDQANDNANPDCVLKPGLPGPLSFDKNLPKGMPNGFDIYGNVGIPGITYYVFYTNSCDDVFSEKKCMDYNPYSDQWSCFIPSIDMKGNLSKDCIVSVLPYTQNLEKGPTVSTVFKVTS